MRREFVFVAVASLATSCAAGQQAALPTWAQPPSATPAAQTVYYAGPGVTAPELLPATISDISTGPCKHLDGNATLSAIVDANGRLTSVFFLDPKGNDLDKIAINLVTAEPFKPGTHDGAPAAVAVAIKLEMKACIEQQENDAGQKINVIRFRSAPDQKIEPEVATPTPVSTPRFSPIGTADVGITVPVVIRSVPAEYSDEGRRKGIQGPCLVSLIVDVHGMPQNLRVARSVEPSLDQNALYAVSQYRFKPAMKKDGTPVPVMISVEVNFRLYR